MKILSKEDMETIEHCIAISKRGEFPPFMVVYDSCEGYTVEADDLIKDMAITAEYIGDVDYLDNQERDDSDSIMSLLRAESSQSVVSCADKHTMLMVNARFFFVVATHDISKGERLYYDHNGHEYQYPTHHFL
ncbi:hypothetical protein GYH30_012914 [Glycine max]|uniref:SET domain-containing protein n=1 Tax=Glycine max TaxID=3847 RepID=A0A0R0K1R6_SOYBN|nr:hypothetical protein GYH30_012914 [Glycine max]